MDQWLIGSVNLGSYIHASTRHSTKSEALQNNERTNKYCLPHSQRGKHTQLSLTIVANKKLIQTYLCISFVYYLIYITYIFTPLYIYLSMAPLPLLPDLRGYSKLPPKCHAGHKLWELFRYLCVYLFCTAAVSIKIKCVYWTIYTRFLQSYKKESTVNFVTPYARFW